MIEIIDELNIIPFWQQLWPGRQIPLMSSMLFPKGYDISIYKKYKPTYFGYSIDGNIIGVNSGHKTSDTDYRSRGLFVLPEFRNRGVAVKLLEATINQAKEEDCSIVWTVPRDTSLYAYYKAGFDRASDFFETETSAKNCYAIYKIDG